MIAARPIATTTPGSRKGGPLVRLLPMLAIGLLVVNLAMVAFSLASLVLPGTERLPERPSILSFLSITSIFVAFPSVGAFLAVHIPRNPVGWLFLAVGLGVTVGVFATEYVGRALLLGAPLPAPPVVAWLSQWSFTPAMGCALTLLPLLFPTGRLVSRRWRIALWAAIATVGAGAIGEALRPGEMPGWESVGGIRNPVGLSGPAGQIAIGLADLSLPALAVVGAVSVGSMIARFRRSAGVERLQLKWPLLAISAAFLTIVVAVATTADIAFHLAMLAIAAIPVAAGLGVMRYRLYEIDRIISRTVSWAVVSGVLVAVFLGGVLALQGALAGVTQGQTFAVAASTLLAFALFQPLRRRVQRAVDRRFDRARYDAEQIVGLFAARLRSQLDLEALESEVGRVATETVRPASAALWLRSAEDRPTSTDSVTMSERSGSRIAP